MTMQSSAPQASPAPAPAPAPAQARNGKRRVFLIGFTLLVLAALVA